MHHTVFLSAHVAVGVTLILVNIAHSQETMSKLGCTFGDEKHIYNIELVPGDHDITCPWSEALTNLAVSVDGRAEELYSNARYLTGLAAQLEDSNQLLWDKVHYLTAEISKLQQQLAKLQAYNKCPQGYDLKNESFKSCYMLVANYLSWYEAERYCLSTGGHLVALETEEEQEFLVKHIDAHIELPGNHIWIGGNDIAKENVWLWAGVNMEMNYTQWLLYPHPDQGPVQNPDNYEGLEHCVHLFHLHDYSWNDQYCSHKHYFVCEYKLV